MFSIVFGYEIAIAIFAIALYFLFHRDIFSLFLMSIVLAIFQASALLNFHIGQHGFGIQPVLFSLFFLLLAYLTVKEEKAILKETVVYFWPLFAFAAFAVVLNFIGPWLFHGMPISNPRVGITGYSEPLQFTSTNITYSIYIVFYVCVFAAVTSYVRRMSLSSVKTLFRITIITFLVVIIISLYQMMVMRSFPGYWPEFLINNKLGVAQLFYETLGNYPKASGTFTEPSFLSYYLSGIFMGLSLLWLTQKEKCAWNVLILLLLAVFGLIITLSSTAYVAMVFESIIILILAWRLSMRAFWKWLLVMLSIFILSCAVHVAMKTIYYRDLPVKTAPPIAASFPIAQHARPPSILESVLFSKNKTQSFVQRNYVDKLALKDFVDSWGVGIGGGSYRASSLLTTFLVGNGIIGLILIILFLRKLFTISTADVVLNSMWRKYIFFFGGSTLGNLIAGCIAVPDISVAFFWLNLSIWIGLSWNKNKSDQECSPVCH